MKEKWWMKEKIIYIELDFGLIMELFDLFKVEYNFVCVKWICVNVIKMFFIDVLIYYISLIELYKKILFCFMLVIGKNKLSLD